MSPITHFFAGWLLFEKRLPDYRDKALVVLAGVAPDIDGLGILVDFGTRALGLPETDFYQGSHRMYGHGLLGALTLASAAGAFAHRKAAVSGFAFLNIHLHFLCDILGSRGTMAEDIWGLRYFAPFTDRHELAWSAQWPLVGWQNMAITAVLLIMVMRRAIVLGYSPVRMFSRNADQVFVRTLQTWHRKLFAHRRS